MQNNRNGIFRMNSKKVIAKTSNLKLMSCGRLMVKSQTNSGKWIELHGYLKTLSDDQEIAEIQTRPEFKLQVSLAQILPQFKSLVDKHGKDVNKLLFESFRLLPSIKENESKIIYESWIVLVNFLYEEYGDLLFLIADDLSWETAIFLDPIPGWALKQFQTNTQITRSKLAESLRVHVSTISSWNKRGVKDSYYCNKIARMALKFI
jgi:hypothetical protein